MCKRLFALALAAGLTIAVADGTAADCSARSGPQRATLLELYTSEGCSSCPPADRWLSGLRGAGIDSGTVIPLAFHVDYWNKLGWPDRFSQPAYSDRQRLASRRNRLDFVYTPQFLMDGADVRSPAYDTLRRQAAQAGRERATIELTASAQASHLQIAATANLVPGERSRSPELFVAVTEDGLSTQVVAGENMGRQLRHDAVVRTLLEPMSLSPDQPARRQQSVPIGADWNATRLTVVAFVQDRVTGDVLQALALPVCR